VIGASLVKRHYDAGVDRESAYEKLRARADARQAEATATEGAALAKGRPPASGGAAGAPPAASGGGLSDILFGSTGPRGGRREGMIESAAKSAARSVGSGLGRQILRGMLGGIFGGKR
jgi:uncharacterized protein